MESNFSSKKSKKRSRAQFEADHAMESAGSGFPSHEKLAATKRFKLNEQVTESLNMLVRSLTIEETKTPSQQLQTRCKNNLSPANRKQHKCFQKILDKTGALTRFNQTEQSSRLPMTLSEHVDLMQSLFEQGFGHVVPVNTQYAAINERLRFARQESIQLRQASRNEAKIKFNSYLHLALETSEKVNEVEQVQRFHSKNNSLLKQI